MEITLFDGCKDNQPTNFPLTFEELALLVQDWAAEPWKRSRKASRQAVIFGRCEGRRANANIRFLSACGADIDTKADDPAYVPFDVMCDRLDKASFTYIAHTTTTSDASHHKYRLILPYGCDVPEPLARLAWAAVNRKFGGVFDKSTHDPARLSFLPAAWTETDYQNERGDRVVLEAPFNACRMNLTGNPILSAAEIAALDIWVDATASPCPAAPRAKVPRSIPTSRATPAKLSPAALAELAHGHADDWIGWRLLGDLSRTPLVSKWARETLPSDEGSRDHRICKSMAGVAMAKGMPINHATLVTLATQWSRKYLGRECGDIAAQAHNALAWCHANRNPTQIAGNDPSQP